MGGQLLNLDLNALLAGAQQANLYLGGVAIAIGLTRVLTQPAGALGRLRTNASRLLQSLLVAIRHAISLRAVASVLLLSFALDVALRALLGLSFWLQAGDAAVSFEKGWRYVGPLNAPNLFTVAVFGLVLFVTMVVIRGVWDAFGGRKSLVVVLGIVFATLFTKAFTTLNCSLGYYRHGGADALSCGLFVLISPAVVGIFWLTPAIWTGVLATTLKPSRGSEAGV